MTSLQEGLGGDSLEARVEQLFNVIPMYSSPSGSWEGLPEHLLVTTGTDSTNDHEYIMIANWITKDKALIARPMLDFDKNSTWQSVFPGQAEPPLFKAEITDILQRPFSYTAGGEQRVKILSSNFEIFVGKIGMWGNICDSDESASALAGFGEKAYRLMEAEFLDVVQLDHLLRVPELTPEAFLTD